MRDLHSNRLYLFRYNVVENCSYPNFFILHGIKGNFNIVFEKVFQRKSVGLEMRALFPPPTFKFSYVFFCSQCPIVTEIGICTN